MRRVRLETAQIHDWESFHRVFKETFGFPNFYGANMDAWIDCMSSITNPDEGMSEITVNVGEVLVLEVSETESFKQRCPEQFLALVECAAFVNRRYVTGGISAPLSFVFL
jgi:RNAse (barnase) inhibitor barstar